MLEQSYWIAGIVVAVVALIGLFRWRKRGAPNITQNANVSGQGNTVNQRLVNESDDGNGD